MPEGRIRYLSPSGLLGYGYPIPNIRRAFEDGLDFVGVDAGSVDPGPYYLAEGANFVGISQVKRDLEPLLIECVNAHIPLIIGTAGGAGARPHVETLVNLTEQIAKERHLRFHLAVIWADIDAGVVLDQLRAGTLSPCSGAGSVTSEEITSCKHIVGQMGIGPITEALDAGADVVIAGRCCDTAVFAALPIAQGFDPGLAFHAAKIAECGTLCAVPGGANDSLLCTIYSDHFEVIPLSEDRRCTPQSVAAHSLYEQATPAALHEPEGVVDLRSCTFKQESSRCVSVTGAQFIPAKRPTIKVEGSILEGYRAICVGGIRDPLTIRNLDTIEAKVRTAIGRSAGLKDFSIRFLYYGRDGVMGDLELVRPQESHEVGVVIDVVAKSQQRANTVLGLARSTLLHQHFPGRKSTAGNVAFPFSPSDLEGGPVYRFALYHLLEVENPSSLFMAEHREVGA